MEQDDPKANGIYSLLEDNTPSRQRFREIHYALRRRITLLQYPPGKRLDIKQLAGEFNVSRTPVRSVLQRLEYQGLVVARHGVGTLVTDIDLSYINEANRFRLKLAEMIGDLSPNPQPAGVRANLDKAITSLKEIRGRVNLEEFARADILVHECNLSLIGNPLLLQVYDEVYYRTARMWFYFLPDLDWKSEIDYFTSDLETRKQALAMRDVKAYGYMVRNSVSASTIRLQRLIPKARAGTGTAVQR